ncbi:hypothetical protein GCM10023203_17800 [Actinomycetospora straminea]|uniref:Uncharacterized protein n=1 Tax=Actinomycetospora straminea TaxID=663607 RepID=A0ABP9ECW0_9PSEU
MAPEEQGGTGGQGERHECLHCTPSDDDQAYGTAAPTLVPEHATGTLRMIDGLADLPDVLLAAARHSHDIPRGTRRSDLPR